VIENVGDLPAGTLGFRASGKISSAEYREMMEPIYAALERGEKLNLYFELAEDFHGLDWGALVQDMKAAGSVGASSTDPRGSGWPSSRTSTGSSTERARLAGSHPANYACSTLPSESKPALGSA
jgi:hypothetical protein